MSFYNDSLLNPRESTLANGWRMEPTSSDDLLNDNRSKLLQRLNLANIDTSGAMQSPRSSDDSSSDSHGSSLSRQTSLTSASSLPSDDGHQHIKFPSLELTDDRGSRSSLEDMPTKTTAPKQEEQKSKKFFQKQSKKSPTVVTENIAALSAPTPERTRKTSFKTPFLSLGGGSNSSRSRSPSPQPSAPIVSSPVPIPTPEPSPLPIATKFMRSTSPFTLPPLSVSPLASPNRLTPELWNNDPLIPSGKGGSPKKGSPRSLSPPVRTLTPIKYDGRDELALVHPSPSPTMPTTVPADEQPRQPQPPSSSAANTLAQPSEEEEKKQKKKEFLRLGSLRRAPTARSAPATATTADPNAHFSFIEVDPEDVPPAPFRPITRTPSIPKLTPTVTARVTPSPPPPQIEQPEEEEGAYDINPVLLTQMLPSASSSSTKAIQRGRQAPFPQNPSRIRPAEAGPRPRPAPRVGGSLVEVARYKSLKLPNPPLGTARQAPSQQVITLTPREGREKEILDEKKSREVRVRFEDAVERMMKEKKEGVYLNNRLRL